MSPGFDSELSEVALYPLKQWGRWVEEEANSKLEAADNFLEQKHKDEEDNGLVDIEMIDNPPPLLGFQRCETNPDE